MKTIITYTVLLAVLVLTACSKKSSSSDTVSYARSVAGTWGNGDTSQSEGNKTWVYDAVFLTKSEASKLEKLIAAVPAEVKNSFIPKFNKAVQKFKSFAHISAHIDLANVSEYNDLHAFCMNNEDAALALLMGQTFNDKDDLALAEYAFTKPLISVSLVKYESLWQQVLAEKDANTHTADGLTIIYSETSLARRLAKKILNQL